MLPPAFRIKIILPEESSDPPVGVDEPVTTPRFLIHEWGRGSSVFNKCLKGLIDYGVEVDEITGDRGLPTLLDLEPTVLSGDTALMQLLVETVAELPLLRGASHDEASGRDEDHGCEGNVTP